MKLSATTIIGDKVENAQGDNLGKIKELMLDVDSGRVTYAVVAFGGFLGLGDKLFAVPWSAFSVDTEEHVLRLNVGKEMLENAEGFDPDNWPDFADRSFEQRLHDHYRQQPYWHA